ncbi:uncharacterized protein LOC134220300 [Armigeres subalbatus]|uniref:uncharacterized protein LOC134220300 n=1 Tax=Armigeres subalbatus TaxID=124917 RepID=UPI002ED1E0B6
MANEGKYVRQAGVLSGDEENLISEETIVGETASSNVPNDTQTALASDSENNTSSSSDDGSYDSDIGDNNTTEEAACTSSASLGVSPQPSNNPFDSRPIAKTVSVENNSSGPTEQITNAERMDRMERMIAGINQALIRLQPTPDPTLSENPDNSWNLSSELNSCASTSGTTSSSIRWEYVKPFPSGIAANKMWEEWNRYIENFEIAASLSNVNDPVKRTQLLFLSMGGELQEIIKAAKLRPSLANPDCYKIFVANIKTYFRSMTDTAAEHEAFSRMKQENGEAAVAFHARLMCKVRSCNYSTEDEDRFVRAQLLSGLKNRELVKQARTYGYETNFIVQSATRDEAFEAETHRQESHNVFELNRIHRPTSYEQNKRKRPNASHRSMELPSKRMRGNESAQWTERRRSKCARCSLYSHRNGQCPALHRNCNKCGKRGHFAAACHQKQLNIMQYERYDGSTESTSFRECGSGSDKQVLKE